MLVKHPDFSKTVSMNISNVHVRIGFVNGLFIMLFANTANLIFPSKRWRKLKTNLRMREKSIGLNGWVLTEYTTPQKAEKVSSNRIPE